MKKEELYTGPVARYVWHVSKKKFRDSIAKNGLVPQPFEKSIWARSPALYYPPAIFVNNHPVYDEWFHLDESKYIGRTSFETDVWRIDTTKLNVKWYLDYNLGSRPDALFTKEHIPVDAIQLFILNKLSCVDCNTIISNLSLDEALRSVQKENIVQMEYIHYWCLERNAKKEVDIDEWAEEKMKRGKIRYLPKNNVERVWFDLIR
jgi:hypothetical protein